MKLESAFGIRTLGAGDSTLGAGDSPVFIAKDVCDVLGISKYRDAIARLETGHKVQVLVETAGGKQNMTALTLDGVRILVAKSRSPQAQDIAKALGMNVYVSPIEADCIRLLEEAFSDLSPLTQFVVHGYRIDLYLAKANIAIECDEHGHADYGKQEERERELKIKGALGCSFVRFNPHLPGFNLGSVVRQIRDLI